jgi:hypothetical protein
MVNIVKDARNIRMKSTSRETEAKITLEFTVIGNISCFYSYSFL